MHGLNKVQLIGSLGRDGVLGRTTHGVATCTLLVGTESTFAVGLDDRGRRPEMTWHRVVLWGKQAEVLAKHLVTGKQVYVEGRLHTRVAAQPDGTMRTTTEVRAEQIILLGTAPGRGRDAHVSDEDIASGAAPEVVKER